MVFLYQLVDFQEQTKVVTNNKLSLKQRLVIEGR